MLTIKQVAERLGVSQSTVRKLIKSRAITAIRVGTQLRVSEDALAEYIRKSSV